MPKTILLYIIIISKEPRQPGRTVLSMNECLAGVGELGVADYMMKPSCWRSTLRSSPVRGGRNTFTDGGGTG